MLTTDDRDREASHTPHTHTTLTDRHRDSHTTRTVPNRPYHGGQRCVKKSATCHVQFSFLIASHLLPTNSAVLLLCCGCLLSDLQCHCLMSFQLYCYQPFYVLMSLPSLFGQSSSCCLCLVSSVSPVHSDMLISVAMLIMCSLAQVPSDKHNTSGPVAPLNNVKAPIEEI